MQRLFYDKLEELNVEITHIEKETIAKRFANSMDFIIESPGFEDRRFNFYKNSGTFERHLFLDYGLQSIPNRHTVLNELMNVAFEIKTNAKLLQKQKGA